MSSTGESESKVDEIIRKFLEKYYSLDKTEDDSAKQGIAGVYEILQDNGLLPSLLTKAQKSNEESERLRSVGNTAYKGKEFEEALSSYTRAICCAKLDGEAIALAYANRSAVHFELQAHDDVIKDVSNALATGSYPENMKHKLFERRAKSYLALLQHQSALEDLTKVISLLTSGATMNTEKVLSQTTNGDLNQEKCVGDPMNGDLELEKIVSLCTNSDLDQKEVITRLLNGKLDQEKALRIKPIVELIAKFIGKPNIQRTKPAEPKLSRKPSKNSKSTFPAIEIAVSPEMGKHAVAAVNISPGDILVVEKPYVSVLTPEFYYSFCDNCKARCRSSIPCGHCNNVVYCSENCCRLGWETHHSIECDLLPTVMDLGCKINILIGIRGLLKATRCGQDLQRFVDEHVNASKATRKSRDKVKVLKSTKPPITNHDDYHCIHNLVTHEEDRSEVQMLCAMSTVSCVIHVLKNATKFFGIGNDKSISVNHIVAANLISRYFMMAGCNAFEIGESTFTPCADFMDYKFQIIGGGLYPTICLLNHSCDPDVSAYMSNEETRILYAIKPIRKGEQIFISYGPEYIHHDLVTRQKELTSKYFFTCKCSPCLNNWPLANKLPEYPTFLSQRVECGQGSRIFETSAKLPEIVQASDRGPISEEQLLVAVQCLSLYHKYVIRPWKYYFAAQRVIRRYFNYKGKHIVSKTSHAFK